MKKALMIFFIVLFVALLLGTFYFLWSKTRPVKEMYTIEIAKMDTLEKRAVATGKIEPRDEVLIKPQISGIISDVYWEAGAMIKKGDVIARVKVIPDMGALSSAESRLALSKISRDQTQREHDRLKQLFESQVLSRDDFEKAHTSLLRANEELQTAQDNLEIVQNGIAKRNAELSNTQIRATVAGMILDVPVKVGNSVTMSNTFNDGTTIASIANMSDMIFRGTVDETEVGRIKEGMIVEIAVGALQDVKFGAVMEYISPKGIDANGVVNFEIKAAATIPDSVFVRAGYSANATIVIDRREGVLSVPESSVVFESGVPCIYVLTSAEGASDQTFDRREVKLGLSNGINVEVLEGVTLEDKIRGAKMSAEMIKAQKQSSRPRPAGRPRM